MQTIFKGNIWVYDPAHPQWNLIASTNACLTQERAQELLNELKLTDWWRHRFVEDPKNIAGMIVDNAIVDLQLEYL